MTPLPGDATLSIATTRDPQNVALVDLAVDGAVGHARILGWGHADLGTRAISGLFAADAPNLSVLTNGAVEGAGSVVISGDDRRHQRLAVRGVIFATEALALAPAAHALVAIDASQPAAVAQTGPPPPTAPLGAGSGSGSGSAAAKVATALAKTGAAAVKATVATMNSNVKTKVAQVMAGLRRTRRSRRPSAASASA